MADFCRIIGGADAGQGASLQPLPGTLLELGRQEVSHFASLSIEQYWIAKTSLLKLKLNDSVQDFLAVLRSRPGAPAPNEIQGRDHDRGGATESFYLIREATRAFLAHRLNQTRIGGDWDRMGRPWRS